MDELRPWVWTCGAAVWDPTAFDGSGGSTRGWATHRATLVPGRLTAEPTGVADMLRIRTSIVYEWPAIVLEIGRFLRTPSVLVAVDGKLGRVYLRARASRVRAALTWAGFTLLEVRTGPMAPDPLARSVIGELASRLPPCVVRSR